MPKGVISAEKRCQGKNRSGEPCKRAATKGRKFCKFHGGHARIGEQNGNYKTGKYSKYFPGQLREKYHEFLEDPDLTTNRQEIAALEVRLSQLIEHVEEDMSQRTWSQWRRLWNQFILAVRTGDGVRQAELVGLMDEFMSSRTDQDRAWGDIERMADSRRKLADSEQKRMVAMQQMLTVEQAMMLMASLISAVKDAVYLYADPTSAKHIIDGTTQAYIELVGAPERSNDGARALTGD
jgi:hypothetical protein